VRLEDSAHPTKLDEDAEILDERRSQADETFQLLDAMEAE